jgi:FkbM family methyltransferase
MIGSFLQWLAGIRLVKSGAALMNRVPLPFARLPVTVRGNRMYAHTLDRYVALWLWKLGWMESSESRLLAQLCRPGMSVVDVGANVGFYTLLFAERAGAEGTVWAFEPDPNNFATLQRNVTTNKCANVITVNSAVGAVSGGGTLYRSGSHSGDHRTYASDDARKRISIKTVALDDFFQPGQPVDLVKMDIQGAEGMALRGMRGVVESNPHLVMFIEVWPEGLRQAHSDPEEVLAELQAWGLILKRVDGKTGALHDIDTPKALLRLLPGSRDTHLLVARKDVIRQ